MILRLFFTSIVLTTLLTACSDDAGSHTDIDGSLADSGADDANVQRDGQMSAHLYAVVAQQRAGENPVSYIALTDDLTREHVLSVTDALEVAGRAVGAGITGDGRIFVGSSESAVVERYELNADNLLEKTGLVSFAGAGVASIGEYQGQFFFASTAKAYYLDPRTASLIVWNPDEMTVEDTIALEGIARENLITAFPLHPVFREGRLFIPIGWRDGLVVQEGAAVAMVDTETDEVTVARDDRCGYAITAAFGNDGMLYVASDAFGAAVHRLAPNDAPAPCMLRLNPGTATFDAGYAVNLTELVGNKPAAGLSVGANDNVYIRAFDESKFAVESDTHPIVLRGAAAWQWWSIELGDAPTASHVSDAPLTMGTTLYVETSSGPVLTSFEQSMGTLFFPTLDGAPQQAGASIAGLAFSTVELR